MSNFLLFKTAGILFACAFEDIIRIVPAAGAELTPAPAFPDYMPGTAVIESEVLPVIDSSLRFGMKSKSDRSYSCMIISSIEKGSEIAGEGDLAERYGKCALIVDEVCGSYETDALMPPPAVNKESFAKYVANTFICNDEICYVIKPSLVIG